LADFDSTNLGDQLKEVNFPNQSEVLGNHHYDDHDSIDVYDDEFPSVSTNILVSKEVFNSKYVYLEYNLVKEYVFMETSSLAHYPLCPTVPNV